MPPAMVRLMETRDLIFAAVMVLSVIVFSYSWLLEFWGSFNPLVMFSAVLMMGSLALLLLSLTVQIHQFRESIEERERSLRVAVQSLEGTLDEKMETMEGSVGKKLDRISEQASKMERRGF